MVSSKLFFTCLIPALFCASAQSGSGKRNFPLDDCSKHEMDVLFLFFDIKHSSGHERQIQESKKFVQDLLNFSANKTTARVRFAQVIDRFSVLYPQVNVSSWRFNTSPEEHPYGLDNKLINRQRYRTVQEAVDLKVKFVQRLFNEMGGVRQNSKKIAVMFIEGEGVSKEDNRNVGRFVRQQVTGIKIFSVIVSNQYGAETVYFNDALMVDIELLYFPKHGLTLVICNKCVDGWVMFEHNDTTQSLSCYKLLKLVVSITWGSALQICHGEGDRLVTIETKTELSFLRSKMASYLSEIRSQTGSFNNSLRSPVYVYIGLHRDDRNSAKRFKWVVTANFKYRPLAFNNWVPGKPSSGRTWECGAWQFVWNGSSGENVGSSDGNGSIDGWVDVDCFNTTSSFILCETVIPRRTEGEKLVKIKPATNESLSKTLAEADFILLGGNVVSVSANVPNTSFFQFIRQKGWDFPVFDCGVEEGDSQYISYVYVCDRIDHCSNRRDETLCDVKQTSDAIKIEMKCEGVSCCDGTCLPFRWVNDGEIDCLICSFVSEEKVSDESEIVFNYLQRNNPCAFTCNRDKCLPFHELGYNLANCLGIDGSLRQNLGQFETANTCFNPLGESIWAPKCVYVKDRYEAVRGCRDMFHLEACEYFECPEGFVKCPDSYCIPQQYVRDGQEDCPSGEEEGNDLIDSCMGNFACWDSQVCIHPDQVCDLRPDCPHGDDEVRCSYFCVPGFRCIAGTMTVSDYNKSNPLETSFIIDTKINYLDLSGIDLSVTQILYTHWFGKVVILILSHCKLRNTFIITSGRVRVLDLSYNKMQTLDGTHIDYFPLENVRHLNLSYNTELIVVKYLEMSSLETLDLSHTGLTDVDESFLDGLPNLMYLNLSFTSITGLWKNVFHSGVVLRTLDLGGQHINSFRTNYFNSLSIRQHLNTDSFQLCCPQIRGANIPDHACHAPGDAISSCFDLIRINVQRVLLWVVAVLAVLGNVTVIVYRVIWDRSVLRTGYGLFVTNLGISDFIMGVYLLIIAGADYYYRGVYVVSDKSWRESGLCRLAGFLATLSCEVSIFFVSLITLDRFLVMKFPFGQIRFSKTSKGAVIFVSWTIGFILALTPIAFNFQIYSSNAMCLALPLTTKRLRGWEFSFGVFVVFNVFMCLVIAFGQRAIFRAMAENRITSSCTSPRRVEDILVAKQLSLVVIADALCCFPVGIIGFLSLAGHEIGNDVFAWTTVFVLPIYAAANPLLYTIPLLVAKWEKYKQSGKNSRSVSKVHKQKQEDS